ncbi:polyphosphate kinase 2 [Pelagicoccus sp. SDUM812002]|uniref:polyphosphate kinase 2 n=1 Tax=Pelagicoccus sp. SDUM812002 TaxID=3041266 RepID=UPI00280D61CC|nr:polyphosphate kinase 2 [Pelagicoccus sp. SDUM812002]MDQ8184379.1 polyphosphate kinase 2 [Pelagicoccus sp. SDUM812002]
MSTELTEEYLTEFRNLQRELVLLQQSIQSEGRRLLVIFEGRDTAGKGGAIRRFSEHLNPRFLKVIALTKPTEIESKQWFFQRYLRDLPNPGEIVFFDRSWYNRAVVEPVMEFCTSHQYESFMNQVPTVENMLIDDGIQIIKLWFSINRTAQSERINRRSSDILYQWKLSTIDALAQEKWDDFTYFKERMFERTHTEKSPWIIVDGNDKATARMESIRYVLSQCQYRRKGELGVPLSPHTGIVSRYQAKDAHSNQTNRVSPQRKPKK